MLKCRYKTLVNVFRGTLITSWNKNLFKFFMSIHFCFTSAVMQIISNWWLTCYTHSSWHTTSILHQFIINVFHEIYQYESLNWNRKICYSRISGGHQQCGQVTNYWLPVVVCFQHFNYNILIIILFNYI